MGSRTARRRRSRGETTSRSSPTRSARRSACRSSPLRSSPSPGAAASSTWQAPSRSRAMTSRRGSGARRCAARRPRPAGRGTSRSTPREPGHCYTRFTIFDRQFGEMGPAGPFFFEKEQMASTYERERELQGEIAPRVEHDLPGVEVLAVELASPDRFVVYVDHPAGVDHALCARVTDVLRDYLREYAVDVSSPGAERPLRTPAHFASVVGRRV